MTGRIVGAVLAVALALAAVLLIGCGGHSTAARTESDEGWMPNGPTGPSVVWAVGDAANGSSASRQVASMVISRHPDRLLYLGDVYENGTALEFDRNYRPLYGGYDAITAPTIGNHEWPNVTTGYVPYWTAVRGKPPPYWYAFAESGWQLISLNSNEPTSSDQLDWLGTLIENTPGYGSCRLAYMHHPRYSAGPHGDLDALQGILDELRGHARIVLAGHDHDMERLRPVDGITQFVDGSGGNELYPLNRRDPRLVFADDTHHGALRIQLRPGRAVLTFVAADGSSLERSAVRCTH
jgi:hypothetical protein